MSAHRAAWDAIVECFVDTLVSPQHSFDIIVVLEIKSLSVVQIPVEMLEGERFVTELVTDRSLNQRPRAQPGAESML